MSVLGIAQTLILPILLLAIPLVWARIQDSFTPSSRLRRRIADHQSLLKDAPEGDAASRLQEEVDRQIDDLVTYWEKRRAKAHDKSADKESHDRAPSDRGVVSSIAILLVSMLAVALAVTMLVVALDRYADRAGGSQSFDLQPFDPSSDPRPRTESDSLPSDPDAPGEWFSEVDRMSPDLAIPSGDCIDLGSDDDDWGATDADSLSNDEAASLLCYSPSGVAFPRSEPLPGPPGRGDCSNAQIASRSPITTPTKKKTAICTQTADGQLASVQILENRGRDVRLGIIVWNRE